MEKKAYKFSFYPTGNQASLLAKSFAGVRFAYLRILKFLPDAYYQDRKSYDGKLYIRKSSEPLNITRWSLALPCQPSTTTIANNSAGHDRASTLCEVDIKPIPIFAKLVDDD